jgi:hypothetical protein
MEAERSRRRKRRGKGDWSGEPFDQGMEGKSSGERAEEEAWVASGRRAGAIDALVPCCPPAVALDLGCFLLLGPVLNWILLAQLGPREVQATESADCLFRGSGGVSSPVNLWAFS